MERIDARRRGDERRFGVDSWISDYLLPSNEFNYSGHTYPFGLNQSMVPRQSKEISATLPGYLSALRTCPPAFASQMYRALVLSQARFVFRNNRISRTPGRMFGTSALGLLEKPWPKATTGELVSRMEWHAGLAGNSYVTNRENNRLRVLRPDWVVIAYGSQQERDDAVHALDGEVIGYLYCNGGIAAGRNKVWTLLPDEIAHWSPLPDPEGANIGMSWITPAIREIQGDRAATEHKLQFFNNAGTPNMVVKGLTAATKEQFNDMVDMMETRHAGLRNAYRTLYLQAGADATVVGANLQQMDFKNTQGAGETRITQLSRVHPVLLGSSEGLQGSSLNAGNFGAARRMFADSWLYPTLQDLAATLAELVRVPGDADLWTDTSDMPILREDAKDAAEIEQLKQTTINGYVREGWTPESAKAAVDGQDVKLLQHTGLVSVQLQPPGTTADTASAGGVGPKVPPVGRSADLRKFDPNEPRDPHSGEWSLGGAIAGAIKDALKLASKIDLNDDEHLIGSGKVDGNYGGFRIAALDRNGVRAYRIGFGTEGFGRASRDDNIRAWDGNPTPHLSAEEHARLTAEVDRLDSQIEDAYGNDKLETELERKRDAIQERLNAASEFNQTAEVDEHTLDRLTTKVNTAMAEATDLDNALRADPENPDLITPTTFVEGVLPGSKWGDIHYQVYLDEPSHVYDQYGGGGGPTLYIGVLPKDDPRWQDGRDWAGTFDASEWRKILRQIQTMRGATT